MEAKMGNVSRTLQPQQDWRQSKPGRPYSKVEEIAPAAGADDSDPLTRIAQMTLYFDDGAPGFWYKNHYVIDGFGALIWLTRWVNRKRGF